MQFSSESLARALGISQSKTLIRKHLSKKFMELIGPVAAQNKVDAMQVKSFVPLDPTEVPAGFSRQRSRSVSNKRSKTDKELAKPLLPIDEFPALSSSGGNVFLSNVWANYYNHAGTTGDVNVGRGTGQPLKAFPLSEQRHSYDQSAEITDTPTRYPTP